MRAVIALACILAVVFENASSVASWTKPAVTSLLTGLYPSQHHVQRAGRGHVDVLAGEVDTLAERLKERGYRTAAFVDNGHLQARSSALDRGFELYREEVEGAPRLAHQFLSWVEGLEKEEAFFAYVHILDPHWPYTPDSAGADAALDERDDRSSAAAVGTWRNAKVVEELYDLEADPGETRNLATGQSETVARLRNVLRAEQARLAGGGVTPGPAAVLDDATRQRLRLLGDLDDDLP